ncbi:MAG: biopolymer transporter ExbD [Bacteroidia bacterium]|nr:biopolymer transporter ExbD [Bacteroidia bacterium]
MGIRKKTKAHSEFGLSAMTDIIFFLLIFFIIAATVSQDPVLKLILPKGIDNGAKPILPIKLAVDANLEYAIDNEKVAYADLPSKLQQVLSKRPDASVSVFGDQTVQYEKVMDLVLMANKQNAKVVLALSQNTGK